jgi:AraC-like DNA-binding protein
MLATWAGLVLHVPDRLAPGERVRAWRPAVPGVVEVFHARFVGHAYPAHTHDSWALLIVDEGAIRYDLDRTEHGAVTSRVTLLPPFVAHNGRAAVAAGFRKRVCYLDETVLPADLAPRAVRGPALADPLLRHRVGQLHDALVADDAELEAESRLAMVAGRLRDHLQTRRAVPGRPPRAVATGLRELLDSGIARTVTLREAGRELDAHPDHLVRSFTAQFGLPPHRYLIGRRVDEARRRLLAGEPTAAVATAVGFHDQAHLSRHFSALLGVPPGRYARSSAATGSGRHRPGEHAVP